MPGSRFPARAKSTLRSLALKEAIVASFALDPGQALLRLAGFEEPDWLSILWWLDISGMAIYFHHRAREIGADAVLPRGVDASLAQRLGNNRIRMKALFDESRALAACFESAGVPYALLKGITLAPHSVPESTLRCQTDLDFLIAARHADRAMHSAYRFGYRLHAQSGNTLEFRAGAASLPDLANLYAVQTQRALELHLAPNAAGDFHLLTRRTVRTFGEARIYTLSPADILVQQALHLLKHLCGEHTRLSWVLEFWRHLKNRRSDRAFWQLAQAHAAETAHGNLAMGVGAWVAEELFGGAQAELPAQWRAEALPVRVRLWLERYARNLLLSDTIGNKLYALLCKEVPGATHPARSTGQILLPRVLPAPMFAARSNENHAERRARYRAEARFILWRLWFHLREGARFAIEASRWNRTVARAER